MPSLLGKSLQQNQGVDILTKYQQKKKATKEIMPNTQAEAVADIISDKLIRKIEESFKSKSSSNHKK